MRRIGAPVCGGIFRPVPTGAHKFAAPVGGRFPFLVQTAKAHRYSEENNRRRESTSRVEQLYIWTRFRPLVQPILRTSLPLRRPR
jgi:hypothetical protein